MLKTRGIEKLIEKRCIWDDLRELVTFVQFKKREKHQWMSATFSKVTR